MGLMRDAATSSRGRIVIGAIVLLVGWKLAMVALAPRKVADDIQPNSAGRVNVRVELTVPAERFHVLAFQKFGRVSGTRENTVDVRSVPNEDLNALARPYWVRRVVPLTPG